MIRLSMPALPPSVNASHINGRGRRFLAPEAREWLDAAIILFRSQADFRPAPEADLSLVVRCYGRWRTADKRAKHRHAPRDLDNMLKLSIDAAAKALGFNDRQVLAIQAEKIEDDRARIELEVESLT